MNNTVVQIIKSGNRYNAYDNDGVKLTSTNNAANSVTITDLDGTTAKVSIGKAF